MTTLIVIALIILMLILLIDKKINDDKLIRNKRIHEMRTKIMLETRNDNESITVYQSTNEPIGSTVMAHAFQKALSKRDL